VFGWAMLSENLFNPLADIREELQEKNTQLLEADQIKNQFLAKMSHELRTPLNSIIGYTDLILDGIYGGLTPQQTDRLEKVIRNGRNLLNLINDILDLSNIEIGQLTLEPTVISTADVLESAIDVVAPQYEAKQLEIIREFDDVPAIFADEQRVRQILYNILSNAVKFTHQGHIRVHTQVINGMVEFAIEDTGIGIPSDKHQFVFEEFRQIDNTATREYGGTGLGMSITKRLVEMSGGRIWLESAPGVGTTFYFTLPRAGTTPIPKVQPPAPVPARERKLKILVVDDEHDIQMYMRDLLLAEKPFWEVTIATSGRDGLRKALRLLPDVITLDIMMPSMDGWEVLKKLQADARLASIPVIIVSHVDHHELAYKFGAKAALVKPINRKELIAHIEKLAYSL
jgi:CheY-like chemotaxis protein/two-component sensor histidine kinase